MRYGIKLICYRGDAATDWQQVDMWVYGCDGIFETPDFESAKAMAEDYRKRNPGGIYEVKQIEEEKC